MRHISGIFLKGLAAILPVFVTVYLIVWIARTAENVLGGIIRFILPESWYVPGIGLLLGIALIFCVGVLLQAYLIRRLFEWSEGLVQRIPLIKTVYSAVQDLMAFVSGGNQRQASQVVLVRVSLGDTSARLMGLVTRQDWDGLPGNMADEDEVAVYMPMSYQVGGYTLILPRKHLEPVDMGIDEAMRFALTAGMSTQANRGASQHKAAE
ncbi:DUF502 domain-containing protein [Aquisalimonas sp. 2447]|uniref:DUF502 domain-containing protein n=1 Tax=Aquisalimonas sp. 2447 TaxID=2740807 RepID=UPI00143246DD|nr:DUF502 domain-containing protein [Aquisalimonas sp. 2447]QIT53793.1 DUF502 domain-containing protein [Aquisalimonas sp. 2447]